MTRQTVDESLSSPQTVEMIHRLFERGIAYTCNGDPRGCERERMGGCVYHEMKESAERAADERLDEIIDNWRDKANK